MSNAVSGQLKQERDEAFDSAAKPWALGSRTVPFEVLRQDALCLHFFCTVGDAMCAEVVQVILC